MTPKGTRSIRFPLSTGEAVHVYSNADQIVLQIRRGIPTEQDITATSFKVGVVLEPDEALRIAGELLTAAAGKIRKSGA
jgi:hypothetical protein